MTGTLPKTTATASTRLALDLSDTMVLFDWNGTIVLDADRAQNALNEVLLSRGLPSLDQQAFTTRFKLPMAAMFTDLGVAEREVETAEDEWNQAMASAVTALRDGVRATLLHMARAGALLRVLSAASTEAVRFDQTSLDVPAVFATVEAPVTDKLERLLSHRAERSRAYYVGDTAYDMRCAVAAGYSAIGVSGGYAPVAVLWEAGATRVIGDLSELGPILQARP